MKWLDQEAEEFRKEHEPTAEMGAFGEDPNVGFQVIKTHIAASSRKLSMKWTIEPVQDLKIGDPDDLL